MKTPFFRWVWQHSVEDAKFTSWASGAPLLGSTSNNDDVDVQYDNDDNDYADVFMINDKY